MAGGDPSLGVGGVRTPGMGMGTHAAAASNRARGVVRPQSAPRVPPPAPAVSAAAVAAQVESLCAASLAGATEVFTHTIVCSLFKA